MPAQPNLSKISHPQAPELLMPAGDIQRLKFAFDYGADAVYLGAPLFSLRARENEFNLEELEKGIQIAHSLKKKVYLTANIFARNLKLKPYKQALAEWIKLKPDALIVSDPGLIMVTKELAPDLDMHLSVQANCMNWESVKFWQKQGITRIILSRELRLTEIQEIKQKVPDIELEAFVHGSICIAFSGRCLLSHYMSYRDANQGVCDNSCRYEFNTYHTPKSVESGEYYIEDLRNKGEFYQIDEDENGSYIMNAKDLCLIEHLKELKEAGVCSFKVEGRTKSVHYVAQVARAYRHAIDEMMENKPFSQTWINDLEKVANRGYHKGFFMGQPNYTAQNYDTSVARHMTQKFAGITTLSDEGKILFEVRNRIEVGQTVEVITPRDHFTDTVESFKNKDGIEVNIAHGGTGFFEMKLRHTPVLPENAIISLIENPDLSQTSKSESSND